MTSRQARLKAIDEWKNQTRGELPYSPADIAGEVLSIDEGAFPVKEGRQYFVEVWAVDEKESIRRTLRLWPVQLETLLSEPSEVLDRFVIAMEGEAKNIMTIYPAVD